MKKNRNEGVLSRFEFHLPEGRDPEEQMSSSFSSSSSCPSQLENSPSMKNGGNLKRAQRESRKQNDILKSVNQKNKGGSKENGDSKDSVNQENERAFLIRGKQEGGNTASFKWEERNQECQTDNDHDNTMTKANKAMTERTWNLNDGSRESDLRRLNANDTDDDNQKRQTNDVISHRSDEKQKANGEVVSEERKTQPTQCEGKVKMMVNQFENPTSYLVVIPVPTFVSASTPTFASASTPTRVATPDSVVVPTCVSASTPTCVVTPDSVVVPTPTPTQSAATFYEPIFDKDLFTKHASSTPSRKQVTNSAQKAENPKCRDDYYSALKIGRKVKPPKIIFTHLIYLLVILGATGK